MAVSNPAPPPCIHSLVVRSGDSPSQAHRILLSADSIHTPTFYTKRIFARYRTLFDRSTEKRSRMGCREVFILLLAATSTVAVEVRNRQKIVATPTKDDEAIQCNHHLNHRQPKLEQRHFDETKTAAIEAIKRPFPSNRSRRRICYVVSKPEWGLIFNDLAFV